MRGLAILGSTGSIGISTLKVVDSHPGAFRVAALAAGNNVELLDAQVRRFRPDLVAVKDAEAAATLRDRLGRRTHPRIVHGEEGRIEAATQAEVDVVVCALVGSVGVRSAWAAVSAGKTLALANKEALVVGGAHLTRRAAETSATILPVDSEHNAIHQCLRGEASSEVRRLWLTASGGPFRTWQRDRLARVTPEQALAHPTWRMGRKITIDSSTLMNKGLEVIEAHWLFGLPGDRIRVLVHPGSVVHSMVEFVDGSFKAQLGVTDMQAPIQYALTWPERCPTGLPPFDPVAAGPLVFEEPDVQRFPCLSLAYAALSAGGAAPAVLNAANEVAVAAFLEGRAGFLDIPAVVEAALARHASHPAGSLDDLLEADRLARETAAAALPHGERCS
ncbi:MAG TPA: 1-deoxy-D-xylulose-5-phosphate reductoisomerase [Candidatus Polarisedimenticolaceae bacterium]|nr:1-deoxy-D-xylulose-5-phosphate reductoisomerase [Candidatus Polarisedimenticolaceae bacterium]